MLAWLLMCSSNALLLVSEAVYLCGSTERLVNGSCSQTSWGRLHVYIMYTSGNSMLAWMSNKMMLLLNDSAVDLLHSSGNCSGTCLVFCPMRTLHDQQQQQCG